MHEAVEKILMSYGAELTLTHGGQTQSVRAFFQPVRARGHQYLERDYGAFGDIPREQYIYLGPVEPAAQVGDTVALGGRKYLLRRAELIYGGREPAYCWGTCVEKGGEDTWDTR